jgi:hypothetical protein
MDTIRGHEGERRQLIAAIRGEISRATGRSYQIDLDAMDVNSLRDLLRLLRDLDAERRTAVQRARTLPWR